jgi:hypothetical protein
MLEAVTLLESLISDRLESRAGYLTGKNEGFQTLGALIESLRVHESVVELTQLIGRIDQWRRRRNEVIHEMVKFEQGTLPTWEDKTSGLAEIASDGQAVLREFAALDARERLKNGARPPATYPGAFE